MLVQAQAACSLTLNRGFCNSPAAGPGKGCIGWLQAALLTLIALASASSTWASQASSLDNFGSYELAELMAVPVFLPTKGDKPYGEAPARLHLITRQQIRARGYRNLVDLLADIPGIHVQRGGEESRYNEISVRGILDHRRFIIMQDGVRIDAPTGEMIQTADDFPLYHAEQVEVMMGPASALYGSDAFSTVINIRTRSGDEIQGGSIGTALGTDGFRYHHFLAGDQISEEWSLAMGGHLHETAGKRLFDDYPRVFPASAANNPGGTAGGLGDYQAPTESSSLFTRMKYGQRLEAGYLYSSFRHSSSVGVEPNSTLYTRDAMLESNLNTLYLKLNYPIGDNIEALTTLDYSQHELDPASNFQNKYSNFIKGYKYFQGRRSGLDQQFNWNLDEDQVLTAGLVYQDYHSIPRTADLPTPYDTSLAADAQGLFHPNTNNTIPIDIMEFDYSNVAGYIQWQADWNDKLYTTLGLRYDRHSEFGSSWNPRLGLLYRLDPENKLRLSYSEAFRAPSFPESQMHYGSFTGTTNEEGRYESVFFRIPTLDLRPEKLRTLELGFQHLFPGGRVNLDLYITDVRDMVVSNALDPVEQYFEDGWLQSSHTALNAGSAQMHGLDISAEYRRKLNADWLLETWGSYSFIDGRLRYPRDSKLLESDLQNTATHKINMGTTFTLNDQLSITPKLRLVSATTSKQAEAFPTSPGYGIIDLHVGLNNLFGISGLAADLEITNLLDKRHYHTGGLISNHNLVKNPQPLRSFFLSLSYAL
jgi:iron complex outermembrane receptor protein